MADSNSTDYGGWDNTPTDSSYTPADSSAAAPQDYGGWDNTPSSGDASNYDFSRLFFDPSSYAAPGGSSAAPAATPATQGAAEGAAPGAAAPAAEQQEMGPLTKIGVGLGLLTKNAKGEYGFDPSNQQSLNNLLKLGVTVPTLIHLLSGGDKPTGQMAPTQMKALVGNPALAQWTPQQQQDFANYMAQRATGSYDRGRTMPVAGRVIVPSQGYATGGEVSSGHRGPLALVQGGGGGQDDTVDARLSPGEYVWDADTVAALGDGNNAHGAKLLDEARENIRSHKRSAPPDSIPPKAKALHAYLPKGALSRVKEHGHG